FIIPNDPEFDKQWHYHNTGQNPPGGTVDADIDAPEGWDISTGGAVIRVGVLDSGIPIQFGSLSHPDLDDPTRYFFGYDFAYGDNDPADDNGHGTHVSGTIAAESDNGIGVAGVCWNAEIMAIKVFDQYGSGSHENFRDGCIYATDNGCKVINYSGGGSAGEAKEHGVAYADSHGVVVCAAAGNNWQGSVSWPGAYSTSYSNVICVSSTDHNDGSSPFSSIGPSVTISAPGGYGSPYDANDVYSTFPNYQVQLNVDLGLPQNYAPLAGTSMATPHVAGFAALILSLGPSITPDSVRQIMINTSEDLGPTGFDNQFGWGRINVYNAVSLLGGITITHTPLEDTKDSLNSYETLCTVFSDTLLLADSLLLRYETSSIWYEETLQWTGGVNEYNAFIPAQSPGTTVNYYLYAMNARGEADTTDLYTFRVIDYALSLAPENQSGTGAVGDTVWHTLQITNDGIYSDVYDLSAAGVTWSTSFWDQLGLVQITQTPSVASDDSFTFSVAVEVPSSLYGDQDVATIVVSSGGDPSVTAEAMVTTISDGQPFAIPFSDDFPTSSINVGKWVLHSGASVSEVGIDEPSPVYSLGLNGDPSGSDFVESQAIDLSNEFNVILRYYYERTGGGDSPETGDDLVVEYLNQSSSWTTIQTHSGGDADMTEYEMVEISLPIDAFHSGLKLRFSATGTVGAYDDWFVDDVFVGKPSDYKVQIAPNSASQFGPAGDSALFLISITNSGLYADDYDLTDSASAWDVSFWDAANSMQITSTGTIQPTESLGILVKIEIPAGTPLNVSSSSWIKASSTADPDVSAYATFEVISAGTAASFPWYEPFPDPFVDTERWMFNAGGEIAGDAYSPPSPPYSLHLDGGVDTLVSQLIDLSEQTGAVMSYYYQRRGPGESPDVDDDLVFEYRNRYGNWIEISRQLGAAGDMTSFEAVSVPLTEDALYNAFQIRVSNFGSGIDFDDWYVDDIRLDYAPEIAVAPNYLDFSLQKGDSTKADIVISNSGLGSLTYNAAIVPIVSKEASVFESMQLAGLAAPAKQSYPEGYLNYADIKGVDNEPPGHDVVFDAGGPDAWGYFWVDSDEPSGPVFDWVDIQATGTEVSGLGDDNNVGPLTIGFTFNYYGIDCSEFYIASNGFIGFGPTEGYNTRSNTTMPATAVPNNILAWCWDDLDPTNANNPGAKVLYETRNDSLIIQFVDYPEYQAVAGAVINAEIILESNGMITYQYSTIEGGFDILGCSVGIEDADGLDGMTVVFNADYLHDALAVKYYAPAQWISIAPISGIVLPGGEDTVVVSISTADLGEGYYQSEIQVTSNDPDPSEAIWPVPVNLTVSSAPTYVCGDADGSESVDIDDAVFIVVYIFSGGPAPDPLEAGDPDCSAAIDIDDAVYLIAYIFAGGPVPCAACL
ncbi:MAG: S8 family serine peptidase, partial [candidate division Zixibacteria bacterium]|nr:S8 family serine peptidase [candidate division Zixibacteria bacterium]MBU1470283.1 S8 family serine peptidase [candidate division Zixibacteria bacterium]